MGQIGIFAALQIAVFLRDFNDFARRGIASANHCKRNAFQCILGCFLRKGCRKAQYTTGFIRGLHSLLVMCATYAFSKGIQ